LVGESQDEKKIELATRIYSEVCTNIRTTDEISFRLLGLVPLVSAAGIFGISLNKEFATSPLAIVISFFAAIVTGALFMWEWRNLKSCRSYLNYAMLLEEHIFYKALGELGEKVPQDKSTPVGDKLKEKEKKIAGGQFWSQLKAILKTIAKSIMHLLTIGKKRWDKPTPQSDKLKELKEREKKIAEGQFRGRPDNKVIRKTFAECIIYLATIAAWTAIGIMALTVQWH